MDSDQREIIAKLAKNHCIGKHHITEPNLLKSLPKHRQNQYKTTRNQLVKQNYIIKHPTEHGWAYSINQKRIKEILEIINSA